MLLKTSEIIKYLRCPKSGQRLEGHGNNQLVTVGDGLHQAYPIINGYPVIIDFGNSIITFQSVEKANAASLVIRKRYKGFFKLLKGLFLPTLKSTRRNVRLLIAELFKINIKPQVLIIGGGTVGQGMEPLYDDKTIQLVAFDIYGSENVQFIADAHRIPLPSSHFDGVVIQAVLEHVLDPTQVVGEISRVLKLDGIVYAETPFMQQVHEGPYDFTRFTESGHRYLFKDFSCISSGVVAGIGTQLAWSIEYFFCGLFRSMAAGKVFKILFFWLRFFDAIIPDKFNVDGASGVFFLGKKIGKTTILHTMVSYYSGAQK